VRRETLDALQELKGLKAHSCPDMDSLLILMTKEVARLWDPAVVHRKRSLGDGVERYVQTGVKAQVWQRDKGKCRNCGGNYALQLDHIKPFSLGGTTSVDNLQLLCRNCNQRKGARVAGGYSGTRRFQGSLGKPPA
jgi:5-methylcytosine-specific restriction endonuclease McrA